MLEVQGRESARRDILQMQLAAKINKKTHKIMQLLILLPYVTHNSKNNPGA